MVEYAAASRLTSPEAAPPGPESSESSSLGGASGSSGLSGAGVSWPCPPTSPGLDPEPDCEGVVGVESEGDVSVVAWLLSELAPVSAGLVGLDVWEAEVADGAEELGTTRGAKPGACQY